MRLTDYLNIECIKIPLVNKTKNKIITELLNLIVNAEPGIDKTNALNCIMERENIESTAIGEGIAIPHARIKYLSNTCISFGVSKHNIDFNSLDGEPAKIFFLLLFPEETIDIQLRILARISRLLKDKNLYNQLLNCKNRDEVMNTFTQYEKRHFS
ncbi:MAG: PTS sugar transporter subunit IIA [Candidatus Aminicenantaceae bacterium]